MSSKIPDVAVFFSAFGYLLGKVTPIESPRYYIVSRKRDVSENYAGILFPDLREGPSFFEPDYVARTFSKEFGVVFAPFAWGDIDSNRDDILRACLDKNVPVYHMAPPRNSNAFTGQTEDSVDVKQHVLQEVQIVKLPLE